MHKAYISKNFNPKTLIKIEQAIEIIEEYQAQGFKLTLRQLYYQFVARDFIANTQREYSKLSRVISDARLCGLISWDAIEDRTRFLREISTWDDPSEILESAANSYREDLWLDQDVYMEVWIEKDALIGVIEPVCKKLRLPFIACRGYMSQSEQWEASQRIIYQERQGKDCIVLHLGDHDPSGMDMTRDNLDRLWLFGTDVTVRRLALNYDQVQQYNPPPNPAKLTDSRAKEYTARHGFDSWELDALEPKVITKLIQDNWERYVDIADWNDSLAREEVNRQKLYGLIEQL